MLQNVIFIEICKVAWCVFCWSWFWKLQKLFFIDGDRKQNHNQDLPTMPKLGKKMILYTVFEDFTKHVATNRKIKIYIKWGNEIFLIMVLTWVHKFIQKKLFLHTISLHHSSLQLTASRGKASGSQWSVHLCACLSMHATIQKATCAWWRPCRPLTFNP